MSIKRTVFTTATLGAALCLPPLVAVAQTGGHAGHPPATPAAATTTAQAAPSPQTASTYRSAFDGYRRFTDEPVKSWKEANDNVGRIGGWKTYAKEAAANGDGDTAAGHAGHGVPSAASGQNPPRAGTANTDKPFGQTEAGNPPKVAPRPTPATPPASQPQAPAGHSKHH
jgi:hypothetical protein